MPIISFVVDDKTAEQIKAEAEADSRTVSNYIAFIYKKYTEKQVTESNAVA